MAFGFRKTATAVVKPDREIIIVIIIIIIIRIFCRILEETIRKFTP